MKRSYSFYHVLVNRMPQRSVTVNHLARNLNIRSEPAH
jgi:hypothetical protein